MRVCQKWCLFDIQSSVQSVQSVVRKNKRISVIQIMIYPWVRNRISIGSAIFNTKHTPIIRGRRNPALSRILNTLALLGRINSHMLIKGMHITDSARKDTRLTPTLQFVTNCGRSELHIIHVTTRKSKQIKLLTSLIWLKDLVILWYI